MKAFAPKGMLSDEELEGLDPAFRSKMEADSAELKRYMSPPGELGLPELLEARRWEWGITDRAFELQPFHDRILIYQIYVDEKTAGGIVKPQTTQERERRECPKGIIVAAGALALDELRANGIDLGHFVAFLRLAPWRYETDTVAGRAEKVIVLRSGDVVGSVDLADNLRAGKIAMKFLPDTYEHVYEQDGQMWCPNKANPLIPGDM